MPFDPCCARCPHHRSDHEGFMCKRQRGPGHCKCTGFELTAYGRYMLAKEAEEAKA